MIKRLFFALAAPRWIARRQRSRFPEEVEKLASTTVALIHETEPDFLRLADSLKTLYTGAAQLGRSTATGASSLRNILRDCNLTGPDGVAAVLLEKLHCGLTATGLELDALTEICTAMRKLMQLGRQVRPMAVLLRTAGYSFRVESARTDATREAFGAFSEELETLANRIGAIAEEIESRAEAAHAELTTLIQSIAGGLKQLREITSHAGPIVRETCEEAQRLLDSSFDALGKAEARTVQISRHADDAIYHVQFGDIVRQKLEHIAFTLKEAAGALAERGDSDDAAKADQILAIQEAQIGLIAHEIESVREGLARAFAGFQAESAGLADEVRGLRSEAAGESSRPDPFEELKKNLRQLEEATAQGAGLREQSRRSWRRAMDASSEVSRCIDQVREINFRMHLQALNAIIRTEWLGEEGRTLRVLSTHMHNMFRESSDLVAGTEAVLETIARGTASSGTSVVTGEGNLEARLAIDVDEVFRAQEELQKTIQMAAGLSRQQSEQLEQAYKNLAFLDLAADRLTTVSSDIAALRREIALMTRGNRTGRNAVSASDVYTMESERGVHRRLLGKESETAPAIPVGAESGDNVEFF